MPPVVSKLSPVCCNRAILNLYSIAGSEADINIVSHDGPVEGVLQQIVPLFGSAWGRFHSPDKMRGDLTSKDTLKIEVCPSADNAF